LQACLGHHRPQNVIDARGIAGAVLLQPFEDVGTQAHGYQFLGRTPELCELLVGERRNIGIVDLGGFYAARLFRTPSSEAFCRSVRGLLQIDSALTRICFPGRDDADDFLAIFVFLAFLRLFRIFARLRRDSLE
jgi:hypothetical protein